MDNEVILTILPPELVEDVEELIPTILLPEKVLSSGSETKD
jgi:hypothetical protein